MLELEVLTSGKDNWDRLRVFLNVQILDYGIFKFSGVSGGCRIYGSRVSVEKCSARCAENGAEDTAIGNFVDFLF